MSIPDHSPYDPAHRLACKAAHFEQRVKELESQRDEARAWVRNLTAETRVLTCVYCGQAYPPGTPDHGDSKLTEHIAVCEKHPLRAAEARIAELEVELAPSVTELSEIREALDASDWPNEGESTVAAVRSLLAARNDLAREVARLRAALEENR